MIGIPVHIILHGLIALVPQKDASGLANHMKALLLRTQDVPGSTCVAKHTPMLVVRTSSPDCENARDAGCKFASQLCTCNLNGEEISLTPDVEPQKVMLGTSPLVGLPFDRSKAGNFGYVANLSEPPFGRQLNPRFLDPTPPDNLVARMEFPFASAVSCALAGRHDEKELNIHALSFRPLGEVEKEGEVSQALAQMVVATYLPEEGTTPTIVLSKFGSAESWQLPLAADPIRGYEIKLMNHRKETLPDDPCDDGVARDFDMFYDLALSEPIPTRHLIPHVKFTRWKSATDLELPECAEAYKNYDSRPICPMSSFNPPQE